MNSRAKGKRGELEFAKFLRERGHEARRGVQFKGGVDSPDVVCSTLSHIHFEVKRVEAGNPYNWMDQANDDAGLEKIPVVAHRRSNNEWLAILSMEDFLRLIDAKNRETKGEDPRVEDSEPGEEPSS